MKLSKKQTIAVMTILILTTMATMADMVLIPVADSLYAAFEKVSLVNYILSGPALVSTVVSALAGKIIEKIGAKRLMIIGFGVFMLSSVAMLFPSQAAVMAVLRTIQGVGWGSCGVVCLVLLAEYFTDEKTRSTMMGIYSAGMSLMGIALGMLSGIVAASGWQHVLYIYLASIPIFLLVLCLPRKQGSGVSAEAEQAAEKAEDAGWGHSLRVCAALFFYNVIYCVVYYQVSVIMTEKGITNSALIGTMSSLGAAGGLAASLLFGFLFGKMKRFTPTVGFAILTVGFAMLYYSSSPVINCVICAVLGAAYSMGVAYYMTYITMIVPPHQVPSRSGVLMAVMGISSFLASYVPYWIIQAFHLGRISETIPVFAVVLCICFVLSIVFSLKERNTVSC